MLKKTPLNSWHANRGAKLVDFAGWEMPLNYGSQIEEHHAVRLNAGIFDVSHMGVVDVTGEDATSYLRNLLANDVAKLKHNGSALYTCMLNEEGGIKDDLIVYRVDNNHYRIVINAAMRDSDIAWMQQQVKAYAVTVKPLPEFCIIAVQGPNAVSLAKNVFSAHVAETLQTLKSFKFLMDGDTLIARTGYTGEDGFEMLVPNTKAEKIWEAFIKVGVKPCGLGARDTLRLEAGLNLYGTDMDETTSPLVSNLAWTVSLKDEDRDFIGREALEGAKADGVDEQLVGLVLKGSGVLRNHQDVFYNGEKIGEITSGGFSPTLKRAIAFARLPKKCKLELTVERRGEYLPVQVVKLPFVNAGEKVYQ